MWDILNALGPQRLVQLRVQADIVRAHGLLGKLDDALYCPRCAFLEAAAVDEFMEVDGVLAGDDVCEGGAFRRLWMSVSVSGGCRGCRV